MPSPLSRPLRRKSVTHVSGTFCYLCVGTVKQLIESSEFRIAVLNAMEISEIYHWRARGAMMNWDHCGAVIQRAFSQMDDAALNRSRRGLRSVLRPQLLQNMLYVVLRGRLCDVKSVRDLFVA